MFEQLIRPQGRNTLVTDSLLLEDDDADPSNDLEAGDAYVHFPEPEKALSSVICKAFGAFLSPNSVIPTKAKSIARIHHHGTIYSVRETHEGNSGILFKGCSIPYHIEKILRLPDNTVGAVWLVVRRLKDPEVDVDPYKAYPHLQARIWGAELEPSIEVFPIDSIEAHFAKCVIPWGEKESRKEVAVVVSLARTRL